MAGTKFSGFSTGATTGNTFIVGYDTTANTNNQYTLAQLGAGLASHIDNIYTADGTLTGDRTITLSGNQINLAQGGSGNFMYMNGTSNNAYFLQGRYNTQIKANLSLNTGSGRLELYAAGGTKYVDLNPQGSVNYLLDKTIIGANTGTPVETLEINGNCKITGQGYTELHTVTSAASITPDWNNSNVQTFELTSASTTIVNPSNIKAGATYILILKQDSTGGRTVSFGTQYNFPADTAPTLTTTANKADVITLVAYSSTVLMCTSVLDFTTT